MKGDMKRLRDLHGVPAKKGGRVIYSEAYNATIVGTWISQRGILCLRIRRDGHKFPINVHPTQHIEYLPEGEK